MAFQFTDTFCTINSTAQSSYDTISGTITYSSAYARFAPPSGCVGGGVFISNSSSLRKNLSGSLSSAIAFLSYGHSGTLNNNQRIISFWNSGSEIISLVTLASGAVQFFNGGLIGSPSAPGLILANQSGPVQGIEVQVVIGTTGKANCWLNGTQIITQNSINTGTTNYNQIQIGDTTGGSAAMYTDYVRLWDASGSYQNAPVGLDRQPITKLPSGVGTNSGMTANGLSPNWRCVSVNPPNSSDFVSANGTNIIDDYAMPVAGLTQAPTMVVSSSYYEKDDSATRTYTNGVLSGASTAVGNTFTANSAYTWVQNCISLDPATGNPWTASGADQAHFLHEELT